MSALAAGQSRHGRLAAALAHASHVLPRQGPIGVFVHHNTLHSFEHLPFDAAVLHAGRLYGAEPYMTETAYRDELGRGRIRAEDIDAVLAAEPEAVIFPRLTRRSLRRAMLHPGVREFDAATILWRAEQGDLARDFRQAALRAIFQVCLDRTEITAEDPERTDPASEIIHPWLIRLCARFLDQGMAYWPMPNRDAGLYAAVRTLVSQPFAIFPRYLDGLDEEFRRQLAANFSAAEAVLDYLDAERIPESEWQAFLEAELLKLPGWAGMISRLEQEPGLFPHQPLPCALVDYLAVRLTLARIASRMAAPDAPAPESPLKTAEKRRLSRAARVYDAARVVRLSAGEIETLSDIEWASFVEEVKACNGLERRRIFQLAYERRHERIVLSALAGHRLHHGLADPPARPAAQVFCCLDEREESFRRALEECDSEIETLGAAGFFGVAVKYKGLDDHHGAALCPDVIRPRHAVYERPVQGDAGTVETRRARRRLLGRWMRHSFISSRTLFRGWLSATALGVLSAVPLAGRLLAPRRYARLLDWLDKAFLPEPRTELAFMRNTAQSQEAVSGTLLGFTVEEKADRVASVLSLSGIVSYARIVLILGHGSSSLNNPHESAHDCGACGGRRGGPNARLFAAMANRPEVRECLRGRGIRIPDDTVFIGGYHDTCNDSIEFYDAAALPAGHQRDLERLRAACDTARAAGAHERVRRFESCGPDASPERALRHVEERSQHLAEPRPEYGHCTNALCVVGRRALTRGLFFDRRAFLTSYDAPQDPDGAKLAALLASVVPVCAGISLEYYFSFVDNDRYGCGTKLPHNVTSLLGVMDGHASDLRTGLPWQMVEIHEPMRMLFVVEAPPERLEAVIHSSPSLLELVRNGWIRIAAIHPDSGRTHIRRSFGFEEFSGAPERLPVALSSAEWYGGKREHLPIACIQAGIGAPR